VDVVLQYLKGEGASCVFGIPGGLLHPFFEAVEQDPKLRLIVTKHEEGAAFMADGFARVNGQLAVCAGTSGPGSTNLITGVAVAFADGVPMLVITGQAPSHSLGKGAAQETCREDIDIVSMFDPITKYSTMVETAARLPHHLRRALRLALSGRQGPVHLNIPVDLWRHELNEDWFDPTTYRTSSQSFDRTQVQRAARILQEAKRPVILAGGGVASSGAADHLMTLAELFPARVATTPRGKGIFPENSPESLGVLGFAGHKAAKETILGAGVDVLMTVGASLNETTTYNWHPGLIPSTALIQLDIDPDRVGRNYPVDVGLVGDAQTILVELIYHCHRLIREGHQPNSVWGKEEPIPSGEARYANRELRNSEATPLTPQRWRRDFQEVLPLGAIVFSDIGGHMLFNIHHLCIEEGQRFILNLGMGSMGHGTAAPIGAALAAPDRPVFAIIGDGCFMMNGMELLTGYDYNVPVIWIVENNHMHGITYHGSKLVSGGQAMESIRLNHRIEIAAIARAMGLPAWIVDAPNQLQPIIKECMAMGKPALIEVRIDPSIAPPLGDRAKTVAGFKRE